MPSSNILISQIKGAFALLPNKAGKWRRAWLFGTWNYEFRTVIEIEPYQLGTVLNFLGASLVPKNAWLKEEFEDVAGAMKLHENASPSCLSVRGKILVSDNEWEDFSYELLTPFSQFKGAHHIVHCGEDKRSSELPNFVDGEKLGTLIPLRITSFEIALMFYESEYTIFLGYSPTPLTEIRISALDRKISITVTGERLKKKEFSPSIMKNNSVLFTH